jgi:hypothetical protein
MHLVQKSKGLASDRRMVSARAQRGLAGATYKSFSYTTFEDTFVRWVSELRMKDLVSPGHRPSKADEELAEAQGKLKDLLHRIGGLKKRISADPDLEGLYDVYKDLEEQKKGLHRRVEALKLEQYRASEEEAVAGVKSIIQIMESAKGNEKVALRTTLRANIGQLVKEIVILVFDAKRGSTPYRCVKAQIHFHNGGVRWLFAAVDRRGNSMTTTVGPKDSQEFGDVRSENAEQVAQEELFGPLKVAKTRPYRFSSVRLRNQRKTPTT